MKNNYLETSKSKIVKRYPKAVLKSCGYKYHKKGCYLILKKDKIKYSESANVLIDYNKKGEIVSIDLIYNEL